ncbi:MAG TPA: hypothetical protein VGB30_01700 [bacterium]|jgi:hypothetical protein
MKKYALLSLILAVLFFLVIGCSGDNKDPVNQTIEPYPDNTLQISSGHYLFGYNLLQCDTENGSIDVIPVRSTDFHLNVTGILNATMGVSASIVPGESDPPNALFVLDITLTHPLSAQKFSGFDITGILITPGSLNVGPLVFANADETRLLNADGYSRWWNPTEFTQPGMFGYTKGNLSPFPASSLTATVNPYKYFADALSAESTMSPVQNAPLDADNGRGLFSAGAVNTRRYQIRFESDPGPKVVFGYAINASWSQPDPNPPVEIPDDFPIEANQPEAYNIAVAAKTSTLFYDSESGTGGGVLRIQANVHDWQGQMAGNIKDQVDLVRFFSPDLFDSGINASFTEEQPTKAIYNIDLSGTAVPEKAGETLIMVRAGSAGGPEYNQGFGPAPDSPVSAWNVLMLDIPDPDCGPDANNAFDEAITFDLNTPISDRICAPTDYRDFYKFSFPLGQKLTGDLILHIDTTPTTFGIYNSDQELISEIMASGGLATLDLDSLNLLPDEYYLRILTQSNEEAVIYLMEFVGEMIIVEPSNAIEVTPQEWKFDPFFIQKEGNYEYAVGLNGIWVMDAADELHPEILYYYKTRSVRGAAMSWPHLFLIRSTMVGNEVDHYDFTNPADPVINKNIIAAATNYTKILSDSSRIYIFLYATPDSLLRIYDYSGDPSSPTFLADYVVPEIVEHAYLRDPETANAEIITHYHHIINAIAVDDPLSISDYATVLIDHVIRNIDIRDNYIYVTALKILGDPMLYVYEHLPGGFISLKGSVVLPDDSTALKVVGDFAYASVEFSHDIMVVNVSNPSSPAYAGTIPTEFNIQNLSNEGDVLYAHCVNKAFESYDLTDPESPALADSIRCMTNPKDLAIEGDYLYVIVNGNFSYTITSVDIHDPGNPEILDSIDAGIFQFYIKVHNGIIATSGGFQKARFFSAEDPSNLVSIFSEPLPETANDIVLTDEAAYFAVYDNQLGLYDISSWPAVTPHGDYVLESHMVDILANGDFLFGSDDHGEVDIYSIISPTSPAKVNSYVPVKFANRVTSVNGYLYIAASDTLEVADLSDPSDPLFVALEGLSYSTYRDIVSDGQYLYAAPGTDSLPVIVINAWPPDDPQELYNLYPVERSDLISTIAIKDNYFIESTLMEGVRIWKLY